MASLQDLKRRFQEAGTTDEAKVLTPEEQQDPRTLQLSVLAKQAVLADKHTEAAESEAELEDEQERAEERKRRDKTAAAFGLSPEERRTYVGPDATPGSLPKENKPQENESLMQRITRGIPSSTAPISRTEEPAASFSPTASVAPAATSPVVKETKPAEEKKRPAATAAAATQGTPIQGILADFQKQVGQISGKAKQDLAEKVGQMNDLERTYRQEAAQSKSDIAKQELAEKMGHALAQLGAGLYGMKKGVDMSSGLQFSKTDWNKRYEAALDELKANLADLREKRQEARLTSTEEAREGIQQAQFTTGVAAQEAAAAQRQKEAEKLERMREGASAQDREADRKNRIEIENIKAGVRQSIASKKLNDAQAAKVDAAAANLADAYEMQQTGTKEEKRLATKQYQEHLQTLNTYLGPDKVKEITNKLEEIPFWGTTSGHFEEAGPEASASLQQAVQQKRGAVPTAGQSAAAGGMVDMVAPDGRALSVPANRVKELEAKGARRK